MKEGGRSMRWRLWVCFCFCFYCVCRVPAGGRRHCRGFDGLLGLRGFCLVFLDGAQSLFFSLMKILVVGVNMVALW